MQMAKNDQHQHIRRVVWTGAVGSAAHALLLFVTNELGFFRGDFSALLALVLLQVAGYLVFFVYMQSGRNRVHADPSLLRPLLFWTTTFILVSAYFVDQVRLCVMIMFFVFMLEGAFRLKLNDFVMLSAYAVFGYLSIIFLVGEYYPENIDRTAELIQWFAFSVSVVGSTVLTGEISSIRYQLERRKKQNETAKHRMEELSIRDELTNLFNRRHAMDLLRHHKGLSDRGAYQFSICYMDLDHFKQINDSFGHPVGDIVLQRVARAVGSSVSGVDHVARFGGEEFVVIIVKSDVGSSCLVCEHLRQAVADIDFSDIEPGLRVSASFGLTMYRPAEKAESFLSRADEALYTAKQSGRNRVVLI